MFRKVWRCFTYLADAWLARADPAGFARRQGVVMNGEVHIYGSSRTMFGSEPFLITLGDNVHICAEVWFITHDGSTLPSRKLRPTLEVAAPITVGDNSFIGCRAMILPGAHIGRNCIVGAGSVVTKPVPDGCVVAGNPAKVVRRQTEWLSLVSDRSLGFGHLSGRAKLQAYRDRFPSVPAS